MKTPWLLYAAALAPLLPLGGALLARRRPGPSTVWVLGWCCLLLSSDAAALALASRNVNNHWLNYAATPAATGLLLWALSLWQTTHVWKLTFGLSIPVFLVAWVALLVLVEDISTFSRIAEPMACLLVLAGATYTIATRSGSEPAPLVGQGWFWVSGGLALYAGVHCAYGPFAVLVLRDDPSLVVRALEVRSGIELVAFLAIARGALCRTGG